MPSKASPYLPHAVLCGAIALFALLPDVPPKPVTVPARIQPGEPLVVAYSQPLKAGAFEGKVTLRKDGQALPGAVQASGETVVFTPLALLAAGETYEFRIEPVQALRGGTLARPLTATVAVAAPELFFLSPDRQLMRAEPGRGEARAVTPEDMEISEYALGPGGRFAAVYLPRGNAEVSGLLLGEEKDGTYELTRFGASGTAGIWRLEMCDRGERLFYLQTEAERETLTYLDLDWSEPGIQKALRGFRINKAGVYERIDAACSQDTSQYAYRTPSGGFVLSFLGEESEEVIGVFDRTAGIAPQDKYAVFQKSLTDDEASGTFRSEISLFGRDGSVAKLEHPDRLFEGAGWNNDATLFSALFIETPSYASLIDFYRDDKGTWERRFTLRPAAGERFIRHALSPDGRLMAAEIMPDENVRIPSAEPGVRLWDLELQAVLPLAWDGSDPQWKR